MSVGTSSSFGILVTWSFQHRSGVTVTVPTPTPGGQPKPVANTRCCNASDPLLIQSKNTATTDLAANIISMSSNISIFLYHQFHWHSPLQLFSPPTFSIVPLIHDIHRIALCNPKYRSVNIYTFIIYIWIWALYWLLNTNWCILQS